MDDLSLDQHDQELMNSIQALGPLLMGARKWQEGSEDARDLKRYKSGGYHADTDRSQPNQAILKVLQAMATLVLTHERHLQQLHKQNCFILFIQSDPQGALPVLTNLSKQWHDQAPAQKDHPGWQTLRTFMFAGLMKELHRRVLQLGSSKAGEQLWETAIKKGTINQDGSWIFQRWSPEQKQLVIASKAPIQMARMVKLMEQAEELLRDNSHVIRFHSLRAQEHIVPWNLQVTMRDAELWSLLESLAHCSVWSLLGMSVKQHNQNMSRQAQTLSTLLDRPAKGHKGGGKGKTKGKQQK